MSVKDYSTTPASNTSLFPEGMAPSAVNDGMRQVQADIRAEVATKGDDIASAATVDLDDATGDFIDITGTTAITSLGTVSEGIRRTVRFTGALTLTHNATSLILPGGANITTADGDIARFRSLGSGNWVCEFYTRADGTAVVATDLSGVADLDTANTFTADQTLQKASPTFTLDADIDTPADDDNLGRHSFKGRNDADETVEYAFILASARDVSDGTEDGRLRIGTMRAGTGTDEMSIEGGVIVGAATGGAPGVGSINATGYEINGQNITTVLETAKVRVRFQPDGTVDDSFNVSSVTDNGTGDFTVNFGGSFQNANYSALATSLTASGGINARISNQADSSVSVVTFGTDGTTQDPTVAVNVACFGDRT